MKAGLDADVIRLRFSQEACTLERAPLSFAGVRKDFQLALAELRTDLDVFTTEPLPSEHPVWSTPGIVVLPHVGGLHPTRDAIVADLWVENLRRFLAGQPLLEVVDRVRGY